MSKKCENDYKASSRFYTCSFTVINHVIKRHSVEILNFISLIIIIKTCMVRRIKSAMFFFYLRSKRKYI